MTKVHGNSSRNISTSFAPIRSQFRYELPKT